MPVSQTLSVTQSTAPVANASTQADAPAWQQALASAQSVPQQDSTPSTNYGDSAAAQAVNEQSAQDTSQTKLAATPSSAGGKTENQTAKPKATTISASTTQIGTTKDDKKDSAQNNIAAVAVALQPAADELAPSTTDKQTTSTVTKTPAASSQIAEHGDTAANDQKLASSQAVAVAPEADTARNTADISPSGTADDASAAPAHTSSPSKPAVQTGNSAAMAAAQNTRQQIDTGSTANIPVPTGTQATADAQTPPQRHDAAAPAQTTTNPPSTASTAQALTARAAQMPQAIADMSASKSDPKEKDSTQPLSALSGVTASTATLAATGTNASSTEASAATSPGNISTSPSALAATVTALHQSGQGGTVLRLDPPGLGHLSVQVGLGAQGQVNVLFVPSTADAAQAIQSSLSGLGSAMAQSGLTLGQAQVGGQFSQQGGGQNGQGAHTPPRQGNTSVFPAEPQTTTSGLSAYA